MPTLFYLRRARRCSPAADLAAAGGAARWGGVLDTQALARLAELDPGGKAGLLPRVIGTYTGSLERLLGQWAAARAAADAIVLRHVAHTLKSSSASVGALALAALCAELEQALREGRLDDLAPRLDALEHEANGILAALRPAAGFAS